MLSLVVPVYRNEEGLDDLLAAVAQLAADEPHGFECVFVIDGSPDRCYEKLRERLPAQPFASQLVLLSRNFGSFAAIRAGLQAGRGDCFAVMAADLQEPPELVATMSRVLHADQADVAIGLRNSREDPWPGRLLARAYWALYRRYVVHDMPAGGVDIFGCNRAFRDSLLKLRERHSSLVAQVFWLGFRRHFIAYDRRARLHGKSAWSFRRKFEYMLDSVFAFTDLPIRVLLRAGLLIALGSALFSVALVTARLAGYIAVPGYAMTMIAIVFFGALNLFALGVVGSYAWRAYENSKQRPMHVVLNRHAWSPQETLNG
jgi:glycosyltransferase involved in cell wall biosynthesis